MTTPRDAESLKIAEWADSGDRIDPDDNSLTPVLDRDTGWPSSFSDPQGDTPRRQVFNQVLREITGMLVEINRRGGMLPWDSRISYVHPAFVFGSDERMYRSKQDSTNENPVGDTAETYWEALIKTVSGTIAPAAATQASETLAGVSEWANQAEMDAGDSLRVARPNVIRNWINNTATFAAARVSGVLAASRIPGLNANKINAGQFVIDRIPALPPSKITVGVTALTDATNIDWDLNDGLIATVTITADRTLNEPTNGLDNVLYILRVTQDGTGGHGLDFHADIDAGDAGTPTLSSDADAVDVLGFMKWGGTVHFMGILPGFEA